MALDVFAYILHKDGTVDDTALELVAAAKKLDAGASVTAVVLGSGIDGICSQLKDAYAQVIKVDDPAFAYVTAEAARVALTRIIPKGAVVMMAHEHFGMDLAPGLSIKLDAAFLPDATGFEGIEANVLKAVREEYLGQVSTHVTCDLATGAVITIRPGAFQPGEASGSGQVQDKTGDAMAGGLPSKRRYKEVVAAEVGEVDITKSEILVSVGRGIEDQDNLEIIHELAGAMGGDVSCSRPIVDAKWLEKARQVGTSGQTVKPKVYMALGISGSFQHLGGIKGSPFIVAVNKNAKAPIFQVADVGIVADILEFVPELTEAVKEKKG